VASDPVDAGYVRTHAAPGAISAYIELGRTMLAAEPRGGEEICQAAARNLGGKILSVESVTRVDLKSVDGFDVGSVKAGPYDLDFWNEYMTLDRGTERLATFPDLIMTLDVRYSMPVTTSQIRHQQQVALLLVPDEMLILGAGMFYEELYGPVGRALGKPFNAPRARAS